MTTILAIDPGNTESAYALIDTDRRPLDTGKIPNAELLQRLLDFTFTSASAIDTVAIEMVASYGMPVGREVFETCVWIGRFHQAVRTHDPGWPAVDLVYRQPVKLHFCHSTKAKDSNVTRALVDRFTPGAPNYGKGTKAAPGWFYGFRADVWAAYALAVYVADMRQPEWATQTTSPAPVVEGGAGAVTGEAAT